tara:strand:- start:575 stop:1450 length:876 start_codon:yes stop_codon:yes gene_type:complete
VTVYIQEHTFGAGKWIYTGYKNAWESIGYKVVFFNNNITPAGDYYVMITDGAAEQHLNLITNSKQCFLYTQPNHFPEPWGTHPNFQCHCSDEAITKLNDMTNVKKWTFSNVTQFFNKWKNVTTVPLAFDNIGYNRIKIDYKFDVCFIGGIANNGFNEKIHIMNETLGYISKKFNCGFFINKNLSHKQENYVLNASKIAINIHDAYQRKLGLDTNERTFKSLGVNGMLVSDEIAQIKDMFSFINMSNDSNKLVSFIEEHINDNNLEQHKDSNVDFILKNHTYIHRVNKLLQL